ncbi:MAG: hypothetical protein K8T89_06755 [Planctomycetes bacterium]|nr:hypothetical protein [Planctomycetota bacterium]
MMKYAVIGIRTLLGLAFVVFGLEHFLHFMKMPVPELPPAAIHLMSAFGPTHYLDVVKVIEIIGGVLLLTGLFVPLGLVLLTPVIVNIALFDVLIMQKPGALGLPMLAMAIFLIWAYRAHFRSVFAMNARWECCNRS